LRALLGTLPVVGLRDGAVLISWVSSSILWPVVLPDSDGVVVLLSGGWDNGVSETNRWWGGHNGLNVVWVVVVVSGPNGDEKSSDGKKFHDIVEKII